jgi:hypothetical protein
LDCGAELGGRRLERSRVAGGSNKKAGQAGDGNGRQNSAAGGLIFFWRRKSITRPASGRLAKVKELNMANVPALVISVLSLLVSFFSFMFAYITSRRSFRPIISAMVKTNHAGNLLIAYDLVVLNSGVISARNIKMRADEKSLAAALNGDASEENKTRWLACFNQIIWLLHNNAHVQCSFGTTGLRNTGFWKYRAVFDITLTYEDWFGRKYEESQKIQIADSNSFTGYSWGEPRVV